MNYLTENTQITLTLPNGQPHIIDGFACDEVEIEQTWWKLIRIEASGVHVVKCLENTFKSYLVPFTEEGYNKHIRGLKPSVKSPFKFKIKEKQHE